jgi:hypothetical protein
MFDSSILAVAYTVVNRALPGADCDTMTRGEELAANGAANPNGPQVVATF